MRANQFIKELSYPGNIGMMELMKFQKVATPEEKVRMKLLLSTDKKAAWELLQDVVKTKLHPIAEAPLPPDWDPAQYKQGSTTFKSRLAYALDRAKKIGAGSSRVATIIDYQGRPTVLKIAKNQKGLAQNKVEADILDDGYARQLDILIPLIDYDQENSEPSWIQTEMATKANERQLCNIMKCDNLQQLVNMAHAILGKIRWYGTHQSMVDKLKKDGKSEQDIEIMSEYANKLADLNNSFEMELGDFSRAANWGIYQGKPVIIDAGFSSNIMQQYYRE